MRAPRELFVISDLHVGGALPLEAGGRGFRINTRMAELCGFLREIAARRRRCGEPIELVINGDIVDFLAETSPHGDAHSAFVADPDEALLIFERVVQRDAAFFEALAELPAAGVALTLVLGNHDLELSLPPVRERLLALLTAGAQAPVRFLYDGEACVIGDVLIEHGNRYDGWNVVDHDALRRVRSAASRRQIGADTAFAPPAGSDMVERVLNPIKRDYPFVDLLKPETGAALPLVLALEPGLAKLANSVLVARLAAQAARHKPAAAAMPAFRGEIAASGSDAALQDLLRAEMGDGAAPLLALIREAQMEAQRRGGEIAAQGSLQRALSLLGLGEGAAYRARLHLLARALRGLRHDRSHERGFETDAELLRAATALAAGGFTTVIFGHTHLAKQVPLPGGATYLNTGTWADLMRVPAALVQGESEGEAALAATERFAQDLRERRFAAYLDWQPTYARVQFDAAGRVSSARLCDHLPGTLEAA